MTLPVLAMVAVLGALVAAALFAAAWWIARDTGLTAGARVVSTDVGAEPATMLTDDILGIRGRPDYLVRETAGLVPIEIKPMRKARTLYESDRVQIGAYMLLARAAYPGTFAGYGRVRYREATFVVPLTPSWRPSAPRRPPPSAPRGAPATCTGRTRSPPSAAPVPCAPPAPRHCRPSGSSYY
jgi:hypothetical protein